MSTDIYGGSINDPFTHTSIPALRLSYSLHLHSKILLDTNKWTLNRKHYECIHTIMLSINK